MPNKPHAPEPSNSHAKVEEFRDDIEDLKSALITIQTELKTRDLQKIEEKIDSVNQVVSSQQAELKARDLEGMQSALDEISKKIEALKAESASRRPVEEIVKYLLYFWFTLSALFGIMGWKQFSDMEEKIRSETIRIYLGDTKLVKDWGVLLKKTEGLYADLQKLTEDYKIRVDELNFAQRAGEHDLEGRVTTLIREAKSKSKDAQWRSKAIATLEKFKDAIETRAITTNLLFNCAQLCRRLDQN